jgi:hypothetical protein
MPPRPFGHTSDRAEREDRDRERRAELNAKYRAEQRRQNAAWEFEKFCKAQQARVAKKLRASADRVNAARWGNPREDRGLFVVTRQGTTECSAPLRRAYQEQERG